MRAAVAETPVTAFRGAQATFLGSTPAPTGMHKEQLTKAINAH